MALLNGILMLIMVSLVVTYLLNIYASWRERHWFIMFLAWTSWFIAFAVVFLLPVDVSSVCALLRTFCCFFTERWRGGSAVAAALRTQAMHRECLKGPASNICREPWFSMTPEALASCV